MNYELFKQLKYAGFPIKKSCLCGDGICVHLNYPTLSELIEACGDRFDELSKISHPPKEPRWVAHCFPCQECGWEGLLSGYGETRKIAVANLYLELNKKS